MKARFSVATARQLQDFPRDNNFVEFSVPMTHEQKDKLGTMLTQAIEGIDRLSSMYRLSLIITFEDTDNG